MTTTPTASCTARRNPYRACDGRLQLEATIAVALSLFTVKAVLLDTPLGASMRCSLLLPATVDDRFSVALFHVGITVEFDLQEVLVNVGYLLQRLSRFLDEDCGLFLGICSGVAENLFSFGARIITHCCSVARSIIEDALVLTFHLVECFTACLVGLLLAMPVTPRPRNHASRLQRYKPASSGRDTTQDVLVLARLLVRRTFECH